MMNSREWSDAAQKEALDKAKAELPSLGRYERREFEKTVMQLRKRIAELETAYTQMESEINGHNEKLKLIPESGERPKNAIEGMRFLATWFDAWYGDAGSGRDIVQQDLRKWARELEAAAQWHDASEPPEIESHGCSRQVLCIDRYNNSAVGYYDGDWLFYGLCFTPIRWRDLPPMSEGKE